MPLRLEVFETETSPQHESVLVVSSGDVEELRLQSYEKGYVAGWEDAVAAAAEERGTLTAEVANNLQRLSFSYHEARNQILRSIRPILTQITARFLPELARVTLAPLVLDRLAPIVEGAVDAKVGLILHPSTRASVEALLTQVTGLELTIVEEPTLGSGQVYLRFGDTEECVDLDAAMAEVSSVLQDFFDCCEKEHPYGNKAR